MQLATSGDNDFPDIVICINQQVNNYSIKTITLVAWKRSIDSTTCVQLCSNTPMFKYKQTVLIFPMSRTKVINSMYFEMQFLIQALIAFRCSQTDISTHTYTLI